MEEAQRIFDYLPVSPPDQEYISFLWETFESNYKNDKFQFAFIAFHMLFMCFVYYQIAKIYKIDPDKCKNLMVFTGKVQNHVEDYENKIAQGKDVDLAPLQKFSLENERTIMGLFLAIQCDREEIKQFKAIVDSRNKIAHSNGNIFYRTSLAVDTQISEIISCIESIQIKSNLIINQFFKNFLLSSQDIENREFPDDESQISQIFITKNYISLADIETAKLMDITPFSSEIGYNNIQKLAEALKLKYPDE